MGGEVGSGTDASPGVGSTGGTVVDGIGDGRHEIAPIGGGLGRAAWFQMLTRLGYTEVERLSDQAYEPPPEPIPANPSARAIERGDTVTRDDRHARNITAVVMRFNQRTATIGADDGGT